EYYCQVYDSSVNVLF
nr:immunoglobulin light chain junction region [Macaca mulatta]MOX17834.1 immunoglobulin light chain junction region [Macaca mulatta]MOX22331.1 immunoglobulin light chain junction region [Macaca mulatta]